MKRASNLKQGMAALTTLITQTFDLLQACTEQSDMGIQRTGLMLYDADLVKVTQRMGISFAVDRKRVAVDNLLALIHTKTTGAYALLSTIPEVIGISLPVKESAKFCGMKIAEANFPEWMRIAFVQRECPEMAGCGDSSHRSVNPDAGARPFHRGRRFGFVA